MKLFLLSVSLISFSFQGLIAQNEIQIPDYKKDSKLPGANYYQIVNNVRAKLQLKKEELLAQGITEKNNHWLREEIAQFERWAYNLSFKIGQDGNFPNSAAGWINIRESNPEELDGRGSYLGRTNAAVWTSIGPFDSAVSNGWTYGGGIGRINVVKQHPVNKNVLFAGSAAGGVFKSVNSGLSWQATTDQFAGLGVSDLVIDPNNGLVMYLATGDFDAAHMNSIGVYKSTDGGNTWNATGLTYTLADDVIIAHLIIDPENSNRIYATTTFRIMRSDNGGTSWNAQLEPAGNANFFNDIVKVVQGATKYIFVSAKSGKLFKSADNGDTFTEAYSYSDGRLDFAYSPANNDALFLLGEVNPAFSKYTISTNTVATFTNITNQNPADNNANFNTQRGYNQVIAVSPTNADSIWIGEFSGKLSPNGGTTWQNKLNGYYEPGGNADWGGSYVHSDHHGFTFIGSDSLLIGNDGGVYVGKISTNDYKQRFNGLVTTQSYSMALFDAEPDNLITGNQDNDGSSRVGIGVNAKYYGAQAGDGTATAVGRSNSNIRYVGGTNGSLSYRTDGFATGFSGTSITTPAGAPFVWDLQMHNTNENIIYGGFADINKMSGAPTGTFTPLNSGAATRVIKITLANNDGTSQKIILMDSLNNIRKSADETNWSTITKPAGVNFSSIYAKKTDWNILFATATAYNAANKVFYSNNNGTTWSNVTKNLPNIVMKKIMIYEGSDTVILATELGVYYALISVITGPPGPGGNEWTKLGGTSLPNVRIEDMEISYAKKKLYAATFGRGVWVTDLSPDPLPLSNILFTYASTSNNDSRYNLSWKIEIPELVSTSLERSTNATNFSTVKLFNDQTKNKADAWPVTLQDDVEYYRLKCNKADGSFQYSNIIKVSRKGGIEITIYPNPVSGYMFVNSKNKISTVTIYTISGSQRAFARPSGNLYQLDMSLLPAGTYIVRVEDEKGNISSEKVIKAEN